MNIRLVRFLLKAVAVGLWIMSTLIVAWAVQGEAPRPADATPPRAPTRSVTAQPSTPSLDAFARLWSKQLRRTPGANPPNGDSADVDDRAANERGSHSRSTASLQVQLVGTILESGRSKAIFVGPAGKVDLKGIGEELELPPTGMRVEAIQLESVGLSYQGQTIILEIQSQEDR